MITAAGSSVFATITDVQNGFGIITDAISAVKDRLLNLPEDEKLVIDAVKLAALFDPALIPLEAAIPIAQVILNLIITNIESHKTAFDPSNADGSKTPVVDTDDPDVDGANDAPPNSN